MRIACLIAVLFCSGCEVPDSNDANKVYIEELQIISISSVNDLIIVDPYIDTGRFDVLLKTGKPHQGFTYELFISINQSHIDAARIYADECTRRDACYDAEYIATKCNLSSSLIVRCGNTFSTNIDSETPTLPASVYLIARVCHKNVDVCDFQHQRVLFR